MLKRILLVLALAVILPPAWYLFRLPDTSVLLKQNPTTSAIRTHREAQMRKKGKKPKSAMVWRSLNAISPNLVRAVVIAEDDTFYQHNGFDIEGIRRAARVNWERKRLAFGGSTLTQQLARTLYLSSHKNFLRKAKEALITRRLEKTLPKKRIMELYLNVVEWGPQIYGAEAASRHFFGKSAIDLTPEEAISLAAILPSPRKWNPLSEKPFMVRRRAVLYDRMVRAGYITPSATDEAPLTDAEEEFDSTDGEEMPGGDPEVDDPSPISNQSAEPITP